MISAASSRIVGSLQSRLPARSGRRAGTAGAERGVRGGEAGDRHAVRRARHVVEADLVTERDRRRIATVLAADPELDARDARRGPSRQPMRTSWPTPSTSSVSNGFADSSLCSRYSLMNRPSMSSREKPNVICVRSLVPNEKNSATSGDLVGDERGARRLDHRADEVVDLHVRLLRAPCSASSRVHASSSCELGLAHDQRDHDLDDRVAARLAARRPRPA